MELPHFISARLDAAGRRLLQPDGETAFDFARPRGEPALIAADSVSWRVFKNPVSVFIGGVAAVILELAEPRVRTGVWEHSAFRDDPARRLRRTGSAAMVTVYGARSAAEAMIAKVVRMHDAVSGRTPGGEDYRANDPVLLNWVQATASFGFVEAYRRYVHPLSGEAIDRFYREAGPAACLYGALAAPASRAEQGAQFRAMFPRLEPSAIVFEFLDIMAGAPILPGALGMAQRVLVRAAVELVPQAIRERLRIGSGGRLRPWEAALVRGLAGVADRTVLPSSPPVQSCLRLGLGPRYLFN